MVGDKAGNDGMVVQVGMPLRLDPAWIAMAAGLLPLLSVQVAYLLSTAAGLVPFCVPFVEGCTSISRAARQGWANHWFKATMLPASALIGLFWWLCSAWLRGLGTAGRRRRIAMLWLGLIAAVFLVLYATFLGVEGKTYQWLRRYGITVYFSFTALAQMLLTSLLARHAAIGHAIPRLLLSLCAAMLLLGLASIPLQHYFADGDRGVNAVEWCYALLMTAVFPVVGLAWMRSGYALRIELRPEIRPARRGSS